MQSTDCRMSEASTDILRSMVGKRMDAMLHDEFRFSPVVFEIVSIIVDGKLFDVTADYTVVDYFGSPEDISILGVSKNETGSFLSRLVGAETMRTPIGETIKDIVLVNDRELMERPGEEAHEFLFTRAIVFEFPGRSLALELGSAIFDQLTVILSRNALRELRPPDSDIDEEERAYTTASRTFTRLREW